MWEVFETGNDSLFASRDDTDLYVVTITDSFTKYSDKAKYSVNQHLHESAVT